jgi:glycosyltransferase involved in cell wall biosynthesis
MTSPHVSVCIPVYQGEQFLEETIRSVLAQTYRNYELVILDNASTDGTSRIAHSFHDPRIRIETNQTTLPPSQNWRRAVELCQAPLIKLLCADDLLHPRCLEMQVPHMDDDPRLALIATRRNMIDENSRIVVSHRGLKGLIGRRSGVEVARRVVRSGTNPIGEPGGVMFRRTDYFAVGGWNPSRRWAMDLDLWIRLLQRGDLFGQPETLAAFRLGAQSLSAENDAQIYHDQNAIMDQITATPQLHIRRVDRAAARIGAPMGRLRRRLLFALSAHTSRHEQPTEHHDLQASRTAVSDLPTHAQPLPAQRLHGLHQEHRTPGVAA